MDKVKEIKLKVMEALQEEAYKGIVRIDSETMKELHVHPGEVVEIEGGRVTVGTVDRAYPTDVGQSVIRMDGIIRRNAKTSIGEYVKVKKALSEEAKAVSIAPAQKGIMIKGNPDFIKKVLLGRAIVKGDLVVPTGFRTRRRGMPDSSFSNPMLDDFFSEFEESLSIGFGLGNIRFIIVSTTPKQPVIITETTKLDLIEKAVDITEEKVPEVTYEDLGGLSNEIKNIREMVELPLKHPEIFEKLGIEPPKGVLLHGPPGTGKTLLAKAVANESEANFILVNGPEIVNKYYGESEKRLREIFDQAEKSAPSIIFFDEIDAIASKREETYGELERRVVSQLLTQLDGLKSRGKVVVIAATNRPNSIDPALRRPGRFDREIQIGVPNKEGRLNILKIHTRNMPLFKFENSLKDLKDKEPKIITEELEELLIYIGKSNDRKYYSLKDIESFIQKYLKDNPKKNEIAKNFNINEIKKILDKITLNQNIVNLSDLAEITHGFVGADIAALCKEAAMSVLRRILPEIKWGEKETIPKEILESLMITSNDFQQALRLVRPSAMREVLVENPNVKWNDIGGLENIQQELKEAVEWPLKHPDAFKRMGIRPPRGLLLHGPPGTGKTLLARAVATESQANFIQIKGPELLNKFVGESEKGVRKIFEKARQVSPSIIFFDEIDAIAPRRGSSHDSHVTENVVNTILAEMDGLEELNNVIVLGATNRPDRIDSALLRPGRFDRILLIGPPSKEGRLDILKIHTKNMPLAKEINLKTLAEKTEGYVGADLESVCREAGLLALRENIKAKEIKKKFFDEALKKVKPSLSPEIMEFYNKEESTLKSAKSVLAKDAPSYLG
ncbi:MAG: CDC48 family AAA ATPase [archaeon]